MNYIGGKNAFSFRENRRGAGMENGNEVLISCRDICKNFGPTRALINVSFELKRGEVCGLIGENGSGKSTLTSIFAGVQPQTSGEIFRQGKPYKPNSMTDAQKSGVAMIVQEIGTLPTLDVAKNIFIGNYEQFSKGRVLNNRLMHEAADKILHEIGVDDIKSNTILAALNFEDRKIVEIARAMYLQPEILIIDESTTALAQKGRSLIYKLIDQMEKADKGVIFISHDLEELQKVCNRIVCLRDGVVVGELNGADITPKNMRPLMVGRELAENFYRNDWSGCSSDEVVLNVDHITSEDGFVQNFSVQLHKGEILGFGGLAGSGMHEVGRMIYGLDRKVTGNITLMPKNKKINCIQDAVRSDIGYISKDRDNESIILNASIEQNTVMASLKKIRKHGLISPRAVKQLSDKQIQAMSTKCVSGKQLCNQLSGGNKQKVAFSKWLAAGSDILIMDCPTRGIDIGVKAAMYKLIYQLRQEGKSIVMISEELPELIGMSDRMIIMKDGKISAEIMRGRDVKDTQLIECMV